MAEHCLLKVAGTRKFMDLGMTPRAYANLRLQQSTTPLVLAYSLVLPFLTDFNRRLEAQIKTIQENGDSGDDLMDGVKEDAKGAAEEAAWKFVGFASQTALTTGIACLLQSREGRLAHSVAYSHDVNFRLPNRYIGLALGKVGLPTSWAGIVAAPCTEADIAYFEGTAPSMPAAFEDSVKRRVVELGAQVVVTTVVAALRDQMGSVPPLHMPPQAAMGALADRSDAHRPRPLEVAVDSARLAGAQLLGGALGAAVGSQVGPMAEFFGECIGAMALAAFLTQKIRTEKQQRRVRDLYAHQR